MEAKDDHFDPAFPKGPWKSDDEALTEIAAYARNPNTGGGAWGARFQAGISSWNESIQNFSSRIGCSCSKRSFHRAGTVDTSKKVHGLNCRWGVELALKNNEWIVESIWPGHFPKSGEGAIKCL